MIIGLHNQRVYFKFPPGAAHIERQMKRQGWYEKQMLEDARSRLAILPNPDGLVVDVGAYCGTHTLWFIKMCKRPVVAFEPVKESFDALLANLKLNGVEAQCLNVGLGAQKSRAKFERHDYLNTGTDTLVSDETGDIEVVPLDHFNLADVALIKIDVEGMELDVLQGALATIRRWHPLLYVEAPNTINQVRELLEGLGYGQFGEFNATPTFGFEWISS